MAFRCPERSRVLGSPTPGLKKLHFLKPFPTPAPPGELIPSQAWEVQFCPAAGIPDTGAQGAQAAPPPPVRLWRRVPRPQRQCHVAGFSVGPKRALVRGYCAGGSILRASLQDHGGSGDRDTPGGLGWTSQRVFRDQPHSGPGDMKELNPWAGRVPSPGCRPGPHCLLLLFPGPVRCDPLPGEAA